MRDWTRRDLSILAGLYLQNDESFVVRRCVQRFVAGELTAQKAIDRSRQHPGVLDEDPHPDNSADTHIDCPEAH